MSSINVIDRLVDLAPPIMEQYFRPDCCIAATRIACGVIGRLGLPVHPQPTRLLVYTWPLWKRLDQWDGTFREGEYSVGIGFGGDKRKSDPTWKGYDGHLVAISQGRIIDLSFGQASRPHKGINLPPAVAIPDVNFPVRGTLNGCVVEYQKHINPKFSEAPDWTDLSRTTPIIRWLVGRIIEEGTT